MNQVSKKSAFTLVELAIVLIIIGLITGGVVGAQSLIKGAERISVGSDLNKYRTAVNAYFLEYDAYPGDHNEAWEYFGNNCADSENDCNGDGNKFIGNPGMTISEAYMMWKHLELAEILNQSFSGEGPIVPGVSCPSLEISSRKDTEMCFLPHSPKYNFEGSLAARTNSGFAGDYPQPSYKLDLKIDDGFSNTGIMKSHGNGCGNINYAKHRNGENPGFLCNWFFYLYGYNNPKD